MKRKNENQEEKEYVRISALILACLCIAAFIVGCLFFAGRFSDEESGGETMYTVCEYGGRIGIFKGGNTFPETVLDIYVFTLPENDAIRLKNGITVYGEDGVRSIIEDFSG